MVCWWRVCVCAMPNVCMLRNSLKWNHGWTNEAAFSFDLSENTTRDWWANYSNVIEITNESFMTYHFTYNHHRLVYLLHIWHRAHEWMHHFARDSLFIFKTNYLFINSKPYTNSGSIIRSFLDDLSENGMNFSASFCEKKKTFESKNEKRSRIIFLRIFYYFPNYSFNICGVKIPNPHSSARNVSNFWVNTKKSDIFQHINVKISTFQKHRRF